MKDKEFGDEAKICKRRLIVIFYLSIPFQVIVFFYYFYLINSL